MERPRIRPATARDAATLARWNRAMAMETEDKSLDPERTLRGVQGVFDDPRRGFYLVAEREGVPVGGLLVTYEWSDWRNGDFWWIQSVYVEAEARRTGVFRALYDEVIRRARAAGAVGVRLYVERANRVAQSTYAALGMRSSDYLMFETIFGSSVQDAIEGQGRARSVDEVGEESPNVRADWIVRGPVREP